MKRRSFLQLLAATPLALRTGKVLAKKPPAKILPLRNPGALAIKAHPKGYRLGWKNGNYRATRGLHGWRPVSYDDTIGSDLGRYLKTPPSEPHNVFDRLVRVGDVVLCTLPLDIWEQGQQAAAMGNAARESIDREVWKNLK